jgi:hypothetical protein
MLYSFLSLYAKLTRYFIAEYHSGQESALVIPGIVRAFVLGNLRSEYGRRVEQGELNCQKPSTCDETCSTSQASRIT